MNEALKEGKNIEFRISDDGSHTLFVPALNEHYHSVFGAIAESRHIFIEAGFNFVRQSAEKIKILEIGFGTGLNALLTLIESLKDDVVVEYTAIELYPLKEDIYSRLNYPEQLEFQGARQLLLKLHSMPWNEKFNLLKNFSLFKINTALSDYQPENQAFNLIYFDAFGPDVQPEMWTLGIFRKMASCLRAGGVLVTYSTKGTVKRNLIETGFSIEKLPGPLGKREILRATLL
jgi:tRNA U34 5-methylaminomethyl-2-thiouridine-forming methyltransferase MnmC